jgi:hypothetical protein
MPAPAPRTWRSRSGGMVSRSSPSSSARPVTVATRAGSRPSSASTETLLPLPDSPTTATVSPGATL